MSTEINIRNMSIKNVINELWNNAEYSSIYDNMKITKPEFNWEKGIKNTKPGGYVDIFCGKILNIIVSSNTINIIGYDRKYGNGEGNKIISKLRSL